MARFRHPAEHENVDDPKNEPKSSDDHVPSDLVVFPFSVLPLAVGIARSVKLVEEAMQADSIVGLFASRDKSIEEPTAEQVYEVGTLARILRVVRGEDGTMQVVVQGLDRIRIQGWLSAV